jgi:predicted HAD superfamily Cof-like phosphohydrolase
MKTITNAQKVKQFMEMFDQSLDENIFDGRASTLRLLGLRRRLVTEEVDELNNAVDELVCWSMQPDSNSLKVGSQCAAFVEIIDALADLLYVTYGFFYAFGVDPDKIFEEVHLSNLSKLDEYGRPIYREDGKVLKGPNYQPPNIVAMLTDYPGFQSS